jgi:hypothetical protein
MQAYYTDYDNSVTIPTNGDKFPTNGDKFNKYFRVNKHNYPQNVKVYKLNLNNLNTTGDTSLVYIGNTIPRIS